VPDEETSVFARLIRRIWGDSNKAQEGLMRLSDLSTGGSGRVERVEGESQTRMHLAAQGLVAGVAITLRQRLPSFVVEMGETTLAMERKVAEGIWLRRSSADRSGDSPR
jgi:Fe2+ transport system protein FeoA